MLVENVPSLALRQGDLSFYGGTITNGLGIPFANEQIPQSMTSPVAQKVLQYLFPLPNAVGPNPVTNNFVDNFPTDSPANDFNLTLDAAADLFGIPAPRPLAIGGGVPNIMINGKNAT